MSEERSTPVTFERGPHLQVAAFCEKVLQERDGTLSLIRVVDRLMFTIQGTAEQPTTPSVTINLTAVISLKAGEARGSSQITLRPELPDGKRVEAVSLPVFLEGEDRGVNLILPIVMQAELEGLYWFDVFFDNILLTRMPLRIVFQRVSIGGTGLP